MSASYTTLSFPLCITMYAFNLYDATNYFRKLIWSFNFNSILTLIQSCCSHLLPISWCEFLQRVRNFWFKCYTLCKEYSSILKQHSFSWHNYESVIWIMSQQEMLVLVIEGRVFKSRDNKTLIVYGQLLNLCRFWCISHYSS